jgi:putative ATPase
VFPDFDPRQNASDSATDRHAPLAERMRPRSLDEVAGQRHLLASDGALRAALEAGTLPSMILWGPPGVGKTTLARLIAARLDAHFVPLSAVTAGVKEVRATAAAAGERRRGGRRTLLFLDEVHRFNKAQQDILLPFVEDGTLILIGATTENPSFEVNRALLSRSQLYVLEALEDEDIRALLQRALDHPDGLDGSIEVEPEALTAIASWASGDARRALGALELAAGASQGRMGVDDVARVLQRRASAMDKGGEHFYNLISALHKSVRGSDPDAALYWLARMLRGGADLRYLARRLIRMASEDVGLADPNALRMAVAARDAADFLGPPEGELALAQLATYLALAPKSNRITEAWSAANRSVDSHPDAEVPLHLRNAPTAAMRKLGYGQGYRYAFDDPEGSAAQRYLPEAIAEGSIYRPGDQGWERRVAERLEALRRLRDEARAASGVDGG